VAFVGKSQHNGMRIINAWVGIDHDAFHARSRSGSTRRRRCVPISIVWLMKDVICARDVVAYFTATARLRQYANSRF
jgi:hypothetical protein